MLSRASLLWVITISSTSLGYPLGGVGEAGWTRCILSSLRNSFTISHCLGQQAFAKGLDFLRQPTGQSKRMCPANRILPSPAGAGLLFQEGAPDRSFTLSVPSVPQKVPLFQLLQLPSQNGFSCPSPQQAETSGPNPKPRSAGQSTRSWLLSLVPSSSLHPFFNFSTESLTPLDLPFILQPQASPAPPPRSH